MNNATHDLRWRCLPFEELSTSVLYCLLALRQRVFVLEQQCLYPDIDGEDARAQHLLGFVDETLVAYARLFAPLASDAPEARIGRILTAPHARGGGLGRALVERAVSEARGRWPNASVAIGAQAHLVDFYVSFGFSVESAPYDEDGIEHVDMRLRAIAA